MGWNHELAWNFSWPYQGQQPTTSQPQTTSNKKQTRNNVKDASSKQQATNNQQPTETTPLTTATATAIITSNGNNTNSNSNSNSKSKSNSNSKKQKKKKKKKKKNKNKNKKKNKNKNKNKNSNNTNNTCYRCILLVYLVLVLGTPPSSKWSRDKRHLELAVLLGGERIQGDVAISPKETPTYPWSIPQESLNPQMIQEFRLINRWFGVWGIFQGYVGKFLESMDHPSHTHRDDDDGYCITFDNPLIRPDFLGRGWHWGTPGTLRSPW